MSQMKRQMEDAAENGAVIATEQNSAQPEAQPQVKVHQVSENLVPFLREVCEQFQSADGKRIRISYFASSDNIIVSFDEELLRNAMERLLANSAKFSPNDSRAKVFVDAIQDKAVIRISDKGVGIPDEVMPYMFEPFVGDDAENLGLYEVKEIVTAHGGTIRAENNRGGGTIFIIELPIEKEVEIDEAVVMEDDE
jgi:signal transduction histidine kinase